MNPHQRWEIRPQLTLIKRYELFVAGQRTITGDAKLTPLGRQVRFGDALHGQVAG
jgi:hypothetical protein